MKNIGISEACSEDWDGMTPTEKGAFCHKCAIEVQDFTNKSSEEIKASLRMQIGKRVCGRILPEQEQALNAEFVVWQLNSKKTMQRAMTLSLIVVFGLTLFSCSSPQEEDVIRQIQQVVRVADDFTEGKTAKSVAGISGEPIEQAIALNEQRILRRQGEDIACELQKELSVDLEEAYAIADKLEENHMIYATAGVMIRTVEVEQFLIEDHLLSEKEQEFDENGIPFPDHFDSKVFPNPMVIKSTYELKVPSKELMVVGLYTMSGEHLRNLHEGELERGTHHFIIDLIDEQPGTYLVVARSKNYSNSAKFIKL